MPVGTPDTFVHGSSRTRMLPPHRIKRFDDEHQSPSHPASGATISAPAPHTLYNSNKGRPAASNLKSGNLSRVIHAASPDTPLHMRRSSSVPFSVWRRNPPYITVMVFRPAVVSIRQLNRRRLNTVDDHEEYLHGGRQHRVYHADHRQER